MLDPAPSSSAAGASLASAVSAEAPPVKGKGRAAADVNGDVSPGDTLSASPSVSSLMGGLDLSSPASSAAVSTLGAESAPRPSASASKGKGKASACCGDPVAVPFAAPPASRSSAPSAPCSLAHPALGFYRSAGRREEDEGEGEGVRPLRRLRQGFSVLQVPSSVLLLQGLPCGSSVLAILFWGERSKGWLRRAVTFSAFVSSSNMDLLLHRDDEQGWAVR